MSLVFIFIVMLYPLSRQQLGLLTAVKWQYCRRLNFSFKNSG